MFKQITKRLGLRNFAHKEEGSVSLEVLIMMPVVFWVYAAMFTIFQTYQEYHVNQQAAYTIGDMISRETLPLDADYLDGVQELLNYMTNSKSSATVRVTSLQYDETTERFYLHWSRARGSQQAATNAEVADWTNRLPTMPDAEYIIVTETSTQYTPPFNIGLGEPNIQNFVFTRARYAPRVLYTGT
jgi:Flp pilus assembly protein TadG